jgi:hypothetical protein
MFRCAKIILFICRDFVLAFGEGQKLLGFQLFQYNLYNKKILDKFPYPYTTSLIQVISLG